MIAGPIGAVGVAAQQLRAGANVNMVGGPASIDVDSATNSVLKILGDPYLQRQNEPSMACSTLDPQMCLASSNDTRLVNAPGLPLGVTGDSWLGIYWTNNAGKTWRSTMLPGFPQDASAAGAASPLKGKEAAADPTVRAGQNGLFFVSGIAFNRAEVTPAQSSGVEAKKGVVFVAVYKDPQNPNLEPIHQGTYIVDNGSSGQFLDKPWIAVTPSDTLACGTAAVVTSVFTGSGTNNQSKLIVHKSTDCGQTWPTANKISESFQINQSGNIAYNALTGEWLVTWRVFGTQNLSVPSQILFSKSTNLRTWTKPTVIRSLGTLNQSLAPDQGTLPSTDAPGYRMFRSNAYPSMCVTTDGVIRIVFAERKGGDPNGDARVQVAKFAGGAWTVTPVEDHPGRGNQFMPAIACSGRTATVSWYDQRNDGATAAFGSHLFGPFIFDLVPPPPTHTLDIRSSRTAAATGQFGPSIQVSRYRFGLLLGSLFQLEYNAVNWPLFGKFPFIGDYIDQAPDRTMVSYVKTDGTTGWRFFGINPNGTENTAEATESVVVHVTWSDNRDVAPSFLSYLQPDPNGGDVEPPGAWVTLNADGQEVQENWQAPGGQCTPAGAPTANKNQNIYTSALTDGLVLGALDESRAAGAVRAYAVYLTNTTASKRAFVVATDRGSLSKTDSSQTSMLIEIPGHNTRGVTVFLSGVPRTTVTATEVDLALPAPYQFLTLKRSVVLNPTPGTIDLEDHAVSLTLNDITTIDNTLFNPENPVYDIENPVFDIENPVFDIENPVFDIENFILDPENPVYDIENPVFDIENPVFDIENPVFDIENAPLDDDAPTAYDQPKVTQVQTTVTNEGTVASGYDLTATIAALPSDLIWQLLVMRVVTTPTTPPTTLGSQCNVLNVPRLQTMTNIGTTLDSAATNFVLGANEKAYVMLRLYHSGEFVFNPQQMAVKVTAQALDTVFDSIGNTAPVATDLEDTTDEDTPRDFTLAASDVDADPLTYTIVDPPDHGTLSGTGANITYTPESDFSGNDSFTFKVNDGGLDSNTATVSITVNAVNDAPIASDRSVATTEDVSTAITLAATDVESATLSYTIGAPAHGTLGGVAPNLTYTPAPDYFGTDSFIYTANDGALDSNMATVFITVGAVNDAPVATNQVVATNEETGIGITLAAADSDSPAISYSVVAGPIHGTLSGSPPSLTYLPAANYFGADSFTFRASDGSLNSNVATVSISVLPVNDPPQASPDSATVVGGAPTVIAVLANDTDIDNGVSTLTVGAITQAPAHGTAVISADGKTINYTAVETFVGIDTFQYTARDPQGAASNPATVTVTDTYGFKGLLAPYQAPPKKSWNIGQSVPIVWQYTNASGIAVDSSSASSMLFVTFTKLAGANPNNCGGGTETSTVITNQDFPGNSYFQYFTAANPHTTAGANTWQFNWQTTNPPVTPGCWKARVILDLNGNQVPGDGIDQVNRPDGFLILVK